MPLTKTDPRLNQFAQRFGQPHVDLACHAAFPMALTPDLLYRLWAHFRSDVHGQPLHIPWVAVADVILSPLCDEVGFDLYEIDTELRAELLNRLKTNPRFGLSRRQALADFLLTYHHQAQLHSDDPDVQDLAQVQRWNALAQGQPTLVVRDLAQKLAGVPGRDGAEWGRMAALMARLPLPEGEAQTLLHYACGMATLSQGDLQPALTHFRQLPGQGRRGVKVAGVNLRVPEAVQQQVRSSPSITRRRLLLGLGLGAVSTVGAVLIHRASEVTVSTPEEMPNGLLGQDVTFRVEVVTVDLQGQEIERQPQEVQGRRWNQGTGFVWEVVNIPAGNFAMGFPEDEAGRRSAENSQHPVNVPAFAMGRYQVTQAQWRFVAERLGQVNRNLEADPASFKGDNRPVESVFWEDAVEFCDRLSAFLDIPCRLPSEAEWEYACRAGTTTPFHFGETITSDLANYAGTRTYRQELQGIYRQETTPVGSFAVANAFGLYDMHGNVWEWCQDVWHDDYEGAPNDGSAWLEGGDHWLEGGDQSLRVLRGGSWDYSPRNCRSASRHGNYRVLRNLNIGFRVVCSPE